MAPKQTDKHQLGAVLDDSAVQAAGTVLECAVVLHGMHCTNGQLASFACSHARLPKTLYHRPLHGFSAYTTSGRQCAQPSRINYTKPQWCVMPAPLPGHCAIAMLRSQPQLIAVCLVMHCICRKQQAVLLTNAYANHIVFTNRWGAKAFLH